MTEEHDVQNRIRAELSHWGTFFRANVGKGWIGNDVTKFKDGSVLIKNARRFSTGLVPGFSDVFGAVPITITPEMIGQTVAVFTAVEVKTKKGVSKPAQINFINIMQSIGCRTGVARSPEDAVKIARGENREK